LKRAHESHREVGECPVAVLVREAPDELIGIVEAVVREEPAGGVGLDLPPPGPKRLAKHEGRIDIVDPDDGVRDAAKEVDTGRVGCRNSARGHRALAEEGGGRRGLGVERCGRNACEQRTDRCDACPEDRNLSRAP